MASCLIATPSIASRRSGDRRFGTAGNTDGAEAEQTAQRLQQQNEKETPTEKGSDR